MQTTHLDLDIGGPLPHRIEVPGTGLLEVTVWLHGVPLGSVRIARREGAALRRALAEAIVFLFSERIVRQLVRNRLAASGEASLALDRLLLAPAAEEAAEEATEETAEEAAEKGASGSPAPDQLTVAITTDAARPELLDRCLAAIGVCAIAPAEVVVVVVPRGGARTPDGRVLANGAKVRWIEAPAADLARARRCAVEATRTPILAFIDERVCVDPHWAGAICRTFRDHPDAAAVIGSVLPPADEPETSRLAREAIDRMAWGNRFDFRRLARMPWERVPRSWLNVLQLGDAANMAFRVEALAEPDSFEPSGRGVTGDSFQHLDLWLRLIEAGRTVVREPAASCRDSAVSSLDEAAARIETLAAGMASTLVGSIGRGSTRRSDAVLILQWFLRNALGETVRRSGRERSIAFARLRGHLAGAWQGLRGVLAGRMRRVSAEVPRVRPLEASPFEGGRLVPIELAQPQATDPPDASARPDPTPGLLAQAAHVEVAEILASWNGQVLGTLRIATGARPLTRAQLRREVTDRHLETFLIRHLGLLPDAATVDGSGRHDRVRAALAVASRRLLAHLVPAADAADEVAPARQMDPDVDVSIVVPTHDRPDDLGECLASILAQRVARRVEVVVVDNHPESGLTGPVVARFHGVRLVAEGRQGAAYARNRGILACRGAIVVVCDDDVVVPEGWLERLLAPFEDPKVGMVTGNILPFRLGSSAERLNETVCSLSRGSEPIVVDGAWFEASTLAVQGWDYGTTANAAIRMDLFRDARVGLFEESLGPGTPVGAGEDPYFIYRVLKAGHRLRYVPDAWVWHKHRNSFRSVRRQVYNYAKSAVGYHLMTLLVDGDRRSISSLLGGLQRHYLRRLGAALRGRGEVPARLALVEIAGHLAGTSAFVMSSIRRRRLARHPAHLPMPRVLPAAPATDVMTGRGDDAGWILGPNRTPVTPVSRVSPAIPVTHGTTGGATPAARPGRLPHFLVIGAQKAGTTALDVNLRKHPDIELVPNFRAWHLGWENTKETWFFNGVGSMVGVGSLEAYMALFNDNGRLQGEVCPSYGNPGAALAIAKTVPDAKLIMICREPVARFESAMNHMIQWHAEEAGLDNFCHWIPTRSFEENLRDEFSDDRRIGLVRMGNYDETIARVLRGFPRERLLLLVAEEYRRDPQATYDAIFDFLGIPRVPIVHEDAHVRKYTTRLTDAQRAWLAAYYRPHNERFFELLGREIPSWHRVRNASESSRQEVA